MKSKAVNIRMPVQLHEKITELAQKDNRSVTNWILVVIYKFIEQEQEQEREEG